MNHQRGLVLLALLLGVGCGKGASPIVDAGTQPPIDSGVELDAGIEPVDSGVPDAGATDAGAACDRASACTVGWTEPSPYPAVVDHHTAFAHESAAGNFLYVVGGVSNSGNTLNTVYNNVRRAKIDPADGSLGAWEDAGALPLPLGFHTQTKKGNRVYLLAGASMDSMGAFASGKVLVGTIDDQGMITWQQGTGISEAVIHGTAAIIGSKLYLIGGAAQVAKNKVMVSRIGGDGLNGPWTTLTSAALPQPRSHHCSVVHNGQIFLFGGLDDNDNVLEEVLRSDFDENGDLVGWKVAGTLPDAPWTAAASLWGESVFIIGGGHGGAGSMGFVDRVRRARFYENNTLQDFADVDPLPTPRSHVHFAPIVDGRIYSVGGRLMPSLTSMNRVFIGNFQP